MAGFRNDTVYGTNVDFSGKAIPAPTITLDNQFLVGTTTPNADGTNIQVGVLTAGAGISLSNTVLADGKFTISASGTPSPTCAFEAYLSSTQNAVTGDGTNYVIPFDTELYDIGNDYSNPTFTAPVDGIYLFNWHMSATGFGVSNTGMNTYLNTTKQDVQSFNWLAITPIGTPFAHTGSAMILLSAGDTASVVLYVGGSGKNINVIGGTRTDAPSYFSAILLAQI